MSNSNSKWSRRKFIINLSGATAVLYASPMLAFDNDTQETKIARIIAKTIGIDTHNHIDVPFKIADFKNQKYDLATEIKKSGLSAICMTFSVDRPNLTQEGEAYQRFLNSLDEMDAVLKDNNMERALSLANLKKAHKKNKPIAIQSIEGGHFLEGHLERLELAYHRGLRHLGLLHDNQSSVPIGDIYTNPPQFGGLTEFGKQIITEANKLGILLDLTHASNDAINDSLAISTKPILISHTGLDSQLGKNERMAKMMKPRLISKEQAKIVANAGGVIGVWTHLADSPLEYAHNIKAMVDVVGIDHVCIGTDTKMATANYPASENTNNGEANKKRERIGEKTNSAWENQKEGFFYSVVSALLETGFNEDEIIKIGGANYCRIFDEATRL
ncbi:peptidase M19 [Flavobacterium sufflavum]|uniref:Peptidase M19 n=1 Tax=Flavobacterium sufflavum TaxID=1921138 RepID=A0A3S2U3X4_9FLAO|nr:membrane dipeptidase [Flavobacterium sufflavum]RVT77567.1 peptidase M19 [Flavobacterium sufflavum]